jgi:hypothetical protein
MAQRCGARRERARVGRRPSSPPLSSTDPPRQTADTPSSCGTGPPNRAPSRPPRRGGEARCPWHRRGEGAGPPRRQASRGLRRPSLLPPRRRTAVVAETPLRRDGGALEGRRRRWAPTAVSRARPRRDPGKAAREEQAGGGPFSRGAPSPAAAGEVQGNSSEVVLHELLGNGGGNGRHQHLVVVEDASSALRSARKAVGWARPRGSSTWWGRRRMEEPPPPPGYEGDRTQRLFGVVLQYNRCRRKNGIRLLQERDAVPGADALRSVPRHMKPTAGNPIHPSPPLESYPHSFQSPLPLPLPTPHPVLVRICTAATPSLHTSAATTTETAVRINRVCPATSTICSCCRRHFACSHRPQRRNFAHQHRPRLPPRQSASTVAAALHSGSSSAAPTIQPVRSAGG